MNFRLIFCLALTAFLFCGAGAVLASDVAPDGSRQVAQMTPMKGAGAAVDAEDAADLDDFDDDEYANTEDLVWDPIYGFNKVMFDINDALFHHVFKPVATGYAWLVPAQPRRGVRNFFTNMLFPVRFVNNVFQGKFDAAGMETSKFIANTAFGFLGLMDVTANSKRVWEPERPTADGLGQTLGKAGFGHGFYIVWPFLGPSSVRESVGWLGDAYLDPLTYGNLSFIEFAGIRVFNNLNSLSLELRGNEYEALTEGAVDKYAAVRDAYIRFRAKKVKE